MSPRGFMWVQASCLAGILVVVALTPASELAFGLALVLAVWWLAWNMLYARALVHAAPQSGGEQPKPPSNLWRARSEERRAGDRHVPRQVLAISAAGILGMLSGILGIDGSLSTKAAFATCVSIVAGIGFVVYASSLVDWYFVLPRVDGVVREPPCRSSRDGIWFIVTRVWYLHRSLAEIFGIVGFVVALAYMGVFLFPNAGKAAAAIGGALLGLIVSAVAKFPKDAALTLRWRGIDKPEYWVGDELRDAAGKRSYVLHLDVGGLIVRAWEKGSVVRRGREESGTWGKQRKLPHENLGSVVSVREFVACRDAEGGCLPINEACELHRLRKESRAPTERARKLVL